ncbi:ABC transporter ATP-binding protein [Hyphomicrobium sp. CS1BSMeth3]|uniref:ABC transporter ATP-binding protein n=1 Tax=Hyphomicrobium sp. CS1BSMeth3 TaxID=1892844 RepID=UPI0009315986|nr:ABC transporter ATP-binding protein [Hyphomicrobium sp. CS1BSMeth3]
MIRLIEVSKSYKVGRGRKHVLRDTTLTFERRNIAVIGQNGAGKSTLLRLIAGAERPDRGHILTEGRVSWPLGFAGGFNASTTGIDNTRFISRIYGQDTDRILDFVRDFSELGAFFAMPVATYSSGMRARLAFAISMAISFDWYLVDEITEVGDDRFKEKCRAAFKEKLVDARILMVSHSVSTLRSYCDMAALVHDGTITLYDDIEKGIAAHKQLMGLARSPGSTAA